MLRRRILARLDIPYEDWNFHETPRIESRGNTSRSDKEIKRQSFPALLQTIFKDMSFAEMYEYLFQEERKSQAFNFTTFETFQQYYLTPEGSKFYFDIFGYEGDARGGAEGMVEFYSVLDSEFMEEEIRPTEGMTALVRALTTSAVKLGTKIYAGNRYEISSISERSNGFQLLTAKKKKIMATKLVIAVPPGPFKKIGGPLATKIQREEVFQSIKAFPAFKAAAVYPRAWWEDITDDVERLHPMEKFLSNSDCLGWTLPHRLVING